jgi:hypothetical protein
MFLGSKARPVRGADNLTAICLESRQFAILNILIPYRTPWLVTGIALLYIYICVYIYIYICECNLVINTE